MQIPDFPRAFQTMPFWDVQEILQENQLQDHTSSSEVSAK
jgi:hypothetical protein